jgi:pilus assembly protein Flp/PilA
MPNLVLALYARFQPLIRDEDGQDILEYAMLISLIALGAVAGVRTVASDLSKTFTNIGNTLNTA